MEDLLIFCAGGHAKVIVDIVEKMGTFRIRGLTDDRPEQTGSKVMGYTVLGPIDDLERMGVTTGIVGIADNFSRARLVAKICGIVPDFRFISAVHPSSVIARDVEIADGTVIMAGCTINPGVRIGRHCIINTHCSLDHDDRMADYSSLAPGVICGGNVTIGKGAAISLGASIIHGITIGEESVIGAGAVVLDDVPERRVAYGNPCRVVRERMAEDRYL